MNNKAHVFTFPKHCNQEVMLRMIVMLMNVHGINTSVFPGSHEVTQEEMLTFSMMHPDFTASYVEIMNFCKMVTMDNNATLINIVISSLSGTGTIMVGLTSKSMFIEMGVFNG
ncbi:hypothetical protein [Shewanella phage FishSpeaker]|nr:hypothetical protein [Shewanella phage FishSpeaker]